MARAHLSLVFIALLGLSACSETPTAVGGTSSDASLAADLSLDLPELAPELFATYSSEPPSPAGRAHSEARDDDVEPGDAPSGVYAQKTVPGFEPGYGYARGEHWYSGNKGRVETTADVSYLGQFVGSQSAFTEAYELFLLDFGRWKFVSATARVYSEHDCGLSITGRSEHTAWWEFFTGVGVAIWGKTARSTAAPPLHQGSCAPAAWTGLTSVTSTFACWYLLTYDLETGAVYDAELLYCDSVEDVE